MSFQAMIDKTRNEYRSVHELSNVEGYAHPNCECCKGAGFYKLPIEKWYEQVMEEVEKTGAKKAPIDIFESFSPGGITVVCNCIEYEKTSVSKLLYKKLESLEKTKKWIESSIGTEYLTKNIANFTWNYPECRNVFMEWMKNPATLYIHGKTKKGKTHLLSCCAQHLAIRNVVMVLYSDIMALASDMSNMSARSAFIDSLCLCDWLLIDDMGTGGRLTLERHNVLKIILDYRVGHKKPFVLTSEHAPDKIFEDAEMKTDNLRWRLTHEAMILDMNGGVK